MEKMKRSDRMGVTLLTLARNPNKVFSLSYFNKLFGTAKSTLSEDIAEAKYLLEQNGLGKLVTLPGVSGGVKYLPFLSKEATRATLEEVRETLSDPGRILPGGFIYTVDVFTNPVTVRKLGQILAAAFYKTNPDLVLTVEASGVPAALMVAEALGKPLVIARRDNRIADGSVVSINYISTSSKRLQTMSLPRRVGSEGRKALIIDDFVKGGGTVCAMCNMMKEFAITVVGVGALIKSGEPTPKVMHEIKSLLTLTGVDEDNEKTSLEISKWV